MSETKVDINGFDLGEAIARAIWLSKSALKDLKIGTDDQRILPGFQELKKYILVNEARRTCVRELK